VTGTVSGNASHLGRFTLHYDLVVDLLAVIGFGTGQLIAANGDRLFTDVLGANPATSVGPGLWIIEEIHTITEGTGRFQGASGGFILTRFLDESTGLTGGSFTGTLVGAKGK
jgi:hypothetical protein